MDPLLRPAVIVKARVTSRLITVVLADGRELSMPLSWSERLSEATKAERLAYEVRSEGTIVSWPEVDEHIPNWAFLGVPEEWVMPESRVKPSDIKKTRGRPYDSPNWDT